MSNKPLKELQSVRITRPTETSDVGHGSESVIVPADSTGAVLEVFGDASHPTSYLVEFYLADMNDFALAFVPAEFVETKYTPEEEVVIAQYTQRASEAEKEVRALDPSWEPPSYWTYSRAKPSPTFTEWVKHLEEVAIAAQARLKELRDASGLPDG